MRTIIKATPQRKPDHANRPETATSGIIMPYTLFQCLLFVASASPSQSMITWRNSDSVVMAG